MANEIKLEIFEVLEKVGAAKKKADKIALLKKYDSFGLKTILQGCYNPNVKLMLPEGAPPYTPAEPHNAPTSLLRKCRDMQYFVGEKARNMKPMKRESIFISRIVSMCITSTSALRIASIRLLTTCRVIIGDEFFTYM